MKLVTFGQAVAGHNVGDTRLVPDALAKTLQDDGVLSGAEPFGAPEIPVEPQKPRRPIGVRDARMAK